SSDGTPVSGAVRFIAGDHGSIVNPAASPAATQDMQTITAFWFATDNTVIPVHNPAGVRKQRAGKCYDQKGRIVGLFLWRRMMMEMMYELAAFVLKAGIVVFAVMFIAGFLVQVSQRQKVRKGELVIDRLSDDLRDGVERLRLELLDKKQRKKAQKSLKQQQKQLAKESPRK